MSPWLGHFRQLSRLRMPFLPLVASAAGGCLLGHYWPLVAEWLALPALVILAGAWLLSGRWPRPALWVLCAGIVSAFSAMHAWREHGAVARQLAQAWPGPVVATIQGTVNEIPREFAQDRSAFRALATTVQLPGWNGELHFPLQVEWRGLPPNVGDQFVATGTFSAFPPARNPGAFDLRGWMASRGIFSELVVTSPSDATVQQPGDQFSLPALAGAARHWAQSTLTEGLDLNSNQALLVVAMTLGDTRPLDDALLESFRGTGTFHLFSVSGLHVGMLGFLLWLMLSTLGLPRAAMIAVIIPSLFFYALVTGWKPASIRAAVMASFVLVGLMAGRPPVVLNSLLAAAFFILLANTRELFNAGFQLSFCVVASLVLLCAPLGETLASRVRPDPFLPIRLYTKSEKYQALAAKRVAPLAAVAMAAWFGSLLLTVGYFHLVSLSAVPANMVCVPLAFFVMAVAMLSLTSGLVSISLAALFNNANWLLTTVLLGAVDFFAALPGSYFFVEPPAFRKPGAEMIVFDFGKGGAVFVQASGKNWLIDSGPGWEHDRTLLPFLRSRGVNRLDGLVLTHGDASHIGGAEPLLKSAQPKRIYESAVDDRSPVRRRLRDGATEAGTPPGGLRAGDFVDLASGVRLQVLYPPADLLSGVADDKALVLLLEIDGRRVLLLSDAGPATEAWLVEHTPQALASEIVIKGAHHSGVAMIPALLDASGPSALVVTNHHFPPSERLPAETEIDAILRGITLYKQNETGAVTIQFWPKKIQIQPFVRQPNSGEPGGLSDM